MNSTPSPGRDPSPNDILLPYLPHDFDIRFSESPVEIGPFKEHLRNLDEHLVLAGTGSLLTMLAVSRAGTLAGLAHQKTFEVIARGEASKISEVFQRQFDSAILDAQFPGRPHLAYFELVGNEDPDAAEVIDQVLKLSQAGLETDPAQITEKTGYRLTRAAPSGSKVGRDTRQAVEFGPNRNPNPNRLEADAT